jgi:hypothetical protein
MVVFYWRTARPLCVEGTGGVHDLFDGAPSGSGASRHRSFGTTILSEGSWPIVWHW